MPNNFRKTGTHYVSKDGSDANPGTDPNAPKLTLDVYGTTTVVGTGDYSGAHNFAENYTNTHVFDGASVIRASADILNGSAGFGALTRTMGETGGYPYWVKLGGFNFISQCFIGTGVYNVGIFEDGGFVIKNDSNAIFNDCVYKDVNFDNQNTGAINGTVVSGEFDYARLFNCTWGGSAFKSITNTYANASTVFTASSWFAVPANDFVNNNWQGAFNIGGTFYELKKDKAGNAINPNPGYSDLILIDATVYDRGNFSQDPLWANLPKGDYWSVQAASPNRNAASNPLNNIGKVVFTVIKKVVDAEFATPESQTDLVLSSGDLIFDPVAVSTEGQVTAEPYVFSTQGGVMGQTFYTAGLNFESLDAYGSTNNSVPAVTDHATGTAGANPRRLTKLVRYKTTAGAPTVPADYDNGGLTAAPGDFIEIELFSPTGPRIDVNGVGDGDPAFIPAGAVKLNPYFIQDKVVLQKSIG